MRLNSGISHLDWYIFRQLVLGLLAVTTGLTMLIWLVQSLRFVDLVVNHGLSLWVFLKLTGLLIPSFVTVILPITTFVIVQFTYQRLAGDRELTVMRAMGLSPSALSRPVMAVVMLVVAAGYALNLSVVPADSHRFWRVSVGNPQPNRGVHVARWCVHAALRRCHSLCPLARSGRHIARRDDRRRTEQGRASHNPGRTRPTGRRSGRAACAAVRRQPTGSGGPNGPTQHPDLPREPGGPEWPCSQSGRARNGHERGPDRCTAAPAKHAVTRRPSALDRSRRTSG